MDDLSTNSVVLHVLKVVDEKSGIKKPTKQTKEINLQIQKFLSLSLPPTNTTIPNNRPKRRMAHHNSLTRKKVPRSRLLGKRPHYGGKIITRRKKICLLFIGICFFLGLILMFCYKLDILY